MALAVEVTGEGAQRRKLAHERAAFDALLTARGQEGADVAGVEGNQPWDGRWLAEVDRQEGQELS